MSDGELLRESISRLELALASERGQREEAEATLAGIRCVVEADDLAAADEALVRGLRPLLHYEAAALLVRDPDDPGLMRCALADHPALAAHRWTIGSLLRRVLGGQTVALFDLGRAPDLAALAAAPELRSALCIPLLTSERPAILVATHPEPAFFSPRHVALARGFARTAAPMLERLAAREEAERRRLAEERAATLAESNEALREQLATIQAQERQIARLAAPVLQVDRQILVIPLIGDLDHDALLRITEALLVAISLHRARVVIFDLTGLDSADAGVPQRLLTLARAAELVGSKCLLTGLRPHIAATLVELEAGLRLRAFGSLADGLVAARELAARGRDYRRARR